MPTADPAQQRALLDVQALDTRSRQAAHRGASLPEHAELVSLEQARADVAGRLEAATRTVAGLQRDLRRAEADVEDVRNRIIRDQTRLDSGTGSPRDLTALQHEIGTLGDRQNTLEEVQLEVMEALETAMADQEDLQTALADLDARISTTTTARDTALAEVQAEREQLAGERESVATRIDPELLALYEKIGARTAVAAAELTGNRCGGCRMELSPVDLAKMKALAPEAIARCEECGAILVR